MRAHTKRETMRIAVGIDGFDSPESIADLVAAGADEFFAGYVPREWSEYYGWEVGLNRRTYGPGCQIRDIDALQRTTAAVHDAGKRIAITFNAHQYTAAQESRLRPIVERVCDVGVDGLVVASRALMSWLREWHVDLPLHLSTGAGCFNSACVRAYAQAGPVRRVVLPRKMTFTEMAALTTALADLDVEFEAMVIGYRCFFNDEYCFTWHGAGDPNFCTRFTDGAALSAQRFPSDWKVLLEQIIGDPDNQFQAGSPLDRLRPAVTVSEPTPASDTRRGNPPPARRFPLPTGTESDHCRTRPPASLSRAGHLAAPCDQGDQSHCSPCTGRTHAGSRGASVPVSDARSRAGGMNRDLPEALYRNCGLCAIRELRRIGVRVLKLPVRGTPWKRMRFVQVVRRVLDHPDPSPEYCQTILDSPDFCAQPGKCYYATAAG